jgi:UDP-galactose transporter B1
MGILQVLGQVSIYYVISNFKQHIFPLISTSRKLFTVLLSILIFKHDLVFWQWIGLGIVIMGMAV